MTKFDEVYLQWYAVRCCCSPEKIFGFIRLSMEPLNELRRVVVDRAGGGHEIELRPISRSYRKMDRIVVTGERAIYSDDRSIEFWRSLPDFVEVSGGDRR